MIDDDALNAWFCAEVLPLERGLTAFIRRNWRDWSEVSDLRQEIFERVLKGAQSAVPQRTGAYVYTVARSHLINRGKRAKIVSFELIDELERLPLDADVLTPFRYAVAREELRLVSAALDKLPPRCREIVALRKIQGLSSREVAEQLGVGVDYVNHETSRGVRLMADALVALEGDAGPHSDAGPADRSELL